MAKLAISLTHLSPVVCQLDLGCHESVPKCVNAFTHLPLKYGVFPSEPKPYLLVDALDFPHYSSFSVFLREINEKSRSKKLDCILKNQYLMSALRERREGL